MRLPSHVQAFLHRHDTMTLATRGRDGAPQAAAVFYAADNENGLYFLSSPSSRHSRSLEREPRAAAAIHAESQSWREIQGLQLEGDVQQVSGGIETARAAAIYVARFDFLRDLAHLLQSTAHRPIAGQLSGMHRALAESRLYVFRPDWVRMIDNSHGFGHKTEWASDSQRR